MPLAVLVVPVVCRNAVGCVGTAGGIVYERIKTGGRVETTSRVGIQRISFFL